MSYEECKTECEQLIDKIKSAGLCPHCFMSGVLSVLNYFQSNEGGELHSPQMMYKAISELSKDCEHKNCQDPKI